MNNELALILDFGGQYNQLIARRIRDNNVYCEIHPYNISIEKIKELNPKGIILTGGPNSVYESGSPQLVPGIFELGVPVLGICYGMQIITQTLGGKVSIAATREVGRIETTIVKPSELFKSTPDIQKTWMTHIDFVETMPQGFELVAKTPDCPVAAMQNVAEKIYGIQFHAEVEHSDHGTQILSNFLDICGFSRDWSMHEYSEIVVDEIRQKVGDKKVLLALSGGVDSSVVAAAVSKAIGSQLTCIFVDHGLMRKNEGDEVEAAFKNSGMNFIRVDAEKRFLDKLAGVTDPERKRKIIGEEFIRIFEEEAKKIGTVDFLAQGTIYADVVESGIGNAAVIKSHHNVGGLPEHVDFKEIIEPLRYLFKDEVRKLGMELGLPAYLVNRQPFPGPGLAIRVMGEVTKERLDILRDADLILREEIAKSNLEKEVNQYFAVLTNTKTVGVMGDFRTYDYTLALRGVKTTDFMTAEWARIPYEVLDKISNRIVSEVPHINRIVYDITSKPPATIEWE